jgi:glycosyltransferase involved in cell wall biosynthesis
LRVLLADDCYPPPLVGGRNLQVQMLAHELARRGHDVEVATMAGPGGSRVEVDGGIPIHRIAGWSRVLGRFAEDPRRTWHPTMPDPGMVRALAELIRRGRPHVVHSHSWILHSLLPLLPSTRTRLVVTMHDYALVCPKGTFVHDDAVCSGPGLAKCIACASGQYGAVRAAALTTGLALTRRARCRDVDRYIAVSSAVARACSSLVAGREQPIEVIPAFLPDDNYETVDGARPEFVPAAGDYVMFAGALAPHKGLDILLEAHAKLDPAIPLVLVGIPSADAPKRFPDGVIVVENVSHDDVLRAWAHCAIAVVPSLWPEPFGLAALEAMVARRPVVASAVGGLRGLVLDGATGVLVPPGDAAALREGIERLLADPEGRERMGRAGRRRAAAYSASAVVPRIERLYREVTAAPPSVLARGRSWPQ